MDASTYRCPPDASTRTLNLEHEARELVPSGICLQDPPRGTPLITTIANNETAGLPQIVVFASLVCLERPWLRKAQPRVFCASPNPLRLTTSLTQVYHRIIPDPKGLCNSVHHLPMLGLKMSYGDWFPCWRLAVQGFSASVQGPSV